MMYRDLVKKGMKNVKDFFSLSSPSDHIEATFFFFSWEKIRIDSQSPLFSLSKKKKINKSSYFRIWEV